MPGTRWKIVNKTFPVISQGELSEEKIYKLLIENGKLCTGYIFLEWSGMFDPNPDCLLKSLGGDFRK